MKILAHSSVLRNIIRLLGVGGALIVVSAVSACSFQVQPIEEYLSESEKLTFRYPATYAVIAEESTGPVSSVLIATRQDPLALDFIPPDEAGIAIQLTPSVVTQPGGVGRELTAEDITASLRRSHEQVGAKVTVMEPFPLGNGEIAHTFTPITPEADMTYFILQLEPDLLAVATLNSASGMDATKWMPDIEMALGSPHNQHDVDALESPHCNISGFFL